MPQSFCFCLRGSLDVWFQLFHHTDEAGTGAVGRFNCKLKMEHFRTFTIQGRKF